MHPVVEIQQSAVCWTGPDALSAWLADGSKLRPTPKLDITLVTHPRDERDLPRLFPWASSLDTDQRRQLARCLKRGSQLPKRSGGRSPGNLPRPSRAL